MTAFGIDYRPKTLKGFVGNDAIVSQLLGFAKKGKFPPAFLISGPTGNGKTTLIRIIARMILGNLDELLEINAGTDNGVDKMRELSEVVRYKPRSGEKRVIAIDECHNITRAAATSLLKTLEEPPPHVHWILATNMPEKLLPELRNRTVYLKLKTPTEEDVVQLCLLPLKKEGVDLEAAEPYVRKIVEACGNSPRLSLNTLAGAYAAVASGESWKRATRGVIAEVAVDAKSATETITRLLKRDLGPLLTAFQQGVMNPFSFMVSWAPFLQYAIAKECGASLNPNPYFDRILATAKPSIPTLVAVMQAINDTKIATTQGGDPWLSLVTQLVSKFNAQD